MTEFVSLYDAKTRLSSLVDQAAMGDEFVISKNGVPLAKLVPIAQRGAMRVPANTIGPAMMQHFQRRSEALRSNAVARCCGENSTHGLALGFVFVWRKRTFLFLVCCQCYHFGT